MYTLLMYDYMVGDDTAPSSSPQYMVVEDLTQLAFDEIEAHLKADSRRGLDKTPPDYAAVLSGDAPQVGSTLTITCLDSRLCTFLVIGTGDTPVEIIY
jgi:hypothetical protein